MSRTVKVRNMILGEGRPKICVPLTDTDTEGLKQSAAMVKDVPFDFVEWRADFFKGATDPAECRKAMEILRGCLGDTPILFTIRTSVENGMLRIDTDSYAECLIHAAESGLIDMVDVELSRGEDTMTTITEAAHAAGVRVIASRHDFSGTPDPSEIIKSLCTMQKLGADVAKFAVMPRCERDVLNLLDATLTMKEEHPDTPVITMSMGSMGSVSRICGELFGSCVTFGTVTKASAPGQLPADTLSLFLKSLH